jgi:hypothetical protein
MQGGAFWDHNTSTMFYREIITRIPFSGLGWGISSLFPAYMSMRIMQNVAADLGYLFAARAMQIYAT